MSFVSKDFVQRCFSHFALKNEAITVGTKKDGIFIGSRNDVYSILRPIISFNLFHVSFRVKKVLCLMSYVCLCSKVSSQ